MVVCDGSLGRCIVGIIVRGPRSVSRVASGQFQRADAREHGVSICNSIAVAFIIVHAISEGSEVANVQLQRASARQYSVGIYEGGLARRANVHCIGE